MLTFAVEVARAAGNRLMWHLGRLAESDVAYKGRVDLVTAADRDSEALILDAITSTYPDHVVMAEEGAPEARGAGARWIVDPLDGTTNFVHGYPLFCVSIALELEGRLELGVVHAPMLGETFAAVRGEGTRLDEAPIRVSETDALIRSLLATGFAYDRWERARNNLGEFGRLTMATQGVRRGGSAALDLAYVAAGRLDGFWEFGLKPWDVAAGAMLVTEAGGRVTDLRGGTDWRDGSQIVATNGVIHDALIEAVEGRDPGSPHSPR